MTTKVVNPSLQLDSAKEMEFLRLSEFNSGETGAFWSNAGGPSPWEMHPDCDELLQKGAAGVIHKTPDIFEMTQKLREVIDNAA